VFLGAGAANATTLEEFSFSYSGTFGGGSVSGSGTLFGIAQGGGEFLLTSGSGTSTEAGNLTLETAGTYINNLAPTDNLISDNLLFPSSNPVLDGDGIVFMGSSLVSDSNYFNIWGNGPGSYTYFNNYDATPYSSGPITFTVDDLGPAATPLPATLPLLAGGLGLFGFLSRRKKRSASQALVAA
jgi:hypothetical protein